MKSPPLQKRPSKKVYGLPLLALGALALIWLLSDRVPRAEGSSLSRSADGWYGFRAALGQQGIAPELSKVPWNDLFELPDGPEPPRSVLVTVLPWQRTLGREEEQALLRFVRRGGAVVVAYADGESGPWDDLLESLGMGRPRRVRDQAPLGPFAWKRWSEERFALEPDRGISLEALGTPAFSRAPRAPSEARIYYRGAGLPTGDPVPLVFGYGHRQGQVIALPASLWSNGEILEPGRLELLSAILADLGERPHWILDEYHHGLLSPELVEAGAANQSWDLFLLHLLILYLLAVWAEGRRFGPVWRRRPARVGSTGEFLETLGGLHHRLGHHREAAEKMAVRVEELGLETRGKASPETVRDGPSFVTFARLLSRPANRSRNRPSPVPTTTGVPHE